MSDADHPAAAVQFVGDGRQLSFAFAGDVTDVPVEQGMLLVPVVTDGVHGFASGSRPSTSALRMNLTQPAAARIRRARLGAPGAGSDGL
ncbi:hypothetical protein ACIOMM_21450 [Streptomyces sp. NPDC087908]|uniref:hypothetical protein n=1 Tax=Streptomyces sp. NPDC087908 TaxID=3365820 RepID=UPI00380F59AE